MKQRVHKIFETQYYYKLCVDCEWDTTNTYATTHVRQRLCSSKLKSPEWKAVKRCVNFACVCVCVENVAIGCQVEIPQKMTLYYMTMWTSSSKTHPVFFFSGAFASLCSPHFDRFDHILRQFRPWADPVDFTMVSTMDFFDLFLL